MNTKTLEIVNAKNKEFDLVHDVAPLDVLERAADMLVSHSQDVTYWNTVRNPQKPSDKVAFEQLLYVAIGAAQLFMLAFGGVAFGYPGFAGAVALALLSGKVALKLVRMAKARRLAFETKRDAGRYEFTNYIQRKLNVPRELVSLDFLHKMCRDYLAFLAANPTYLTQKRQAERQAELEREANKLENRLARAREAGREAARAMFGKATRSTKASHTAGRTAAGFGAVAAGAVAGSAMAADTPMMQINPATGLPMLNDAVDVNGNIFGTSLMDDMVNQHHHEVSTPSVPSTTDFGGGFGGGFDGGSFGGGGFDNNF